MNYPYPQNGYGAMPNTNPYAYWPYTYPYPYGPGAQQCHQSTEGSSTANYLSSRWNMGLSPSLVILVIVAGVIGWWQFGRAFINGDSSNYQYVTAGVQAGAVLILLSIAINVIGSSSGIGQLELTYQHMLIGLLVCCLLWNYVAAVSAKSSGKGTDEEESAPSKSSSSKSSSSKSSSSRPSGSSSSKSSSSAPKESSRSSSSSSSRAAEASGGAAKKPSSSSVSDPDRSSRSSHSETPKSSSSSRSSGSKDTSKENKEEERDPWEKSHPSEHLSSSNKDRPRLWPFPIGFDKARPAGAQKLWWESGVPHVVGTVGDPAGRGVSTAASAPANSDITSGREGTSSSSTTKDSSRTGDTGGNANPVTAPSTGVSAVSSSNGNSAKSSASTDADDVKQRERLKALYMQMKKDPNADPETLRKLKKSLLETSPSSGSEKSRSVPSAAAGPDDSVQEKIDILTAQYMKLKGDPNSDADARKRLKIKIGQLKLALNGSTASNGPTDRAPLEDVPSTDPADRREPVEDPAKGSTGDVRGEDDRQKLKARYLKMKSDPNVDPVELAKLKAAIVGTSTGKEPKSVAFDPSIPTASSRHPSRTAGSSKSDHDPPGPLSEQVTPIDQGQSSEPALRKKLRQLQMAICVAAVTILNLPIGILCGIGFAIYLLEEMMDPHSNTSTGSDKPPSDSEHRPKDKPTTTSRSSDSKGTSTSSSSSGSSSSKRLSESEKAALPTSTGKNKDKDKSDRLPPVSMMYMSTPNPKTPHVWNGPEFPLAVQGTSSALVSSMFTP